MILKPSGTVFFVDSLSEQTSAAIDSGSSTSSGMSRRKLNDGREFDIVKIYYDPLELKQRLMADGWTASCRVHFRTRCPFREKSMDSAPIRTASWPA